MKHRRSRAPHGDARSTGRFLRPGDSAAARGGGAPRTSRFVAVALVATLFGCADPLGGDEAEADGAPPPRGVVADAAFVRDAGATDGAAPVPSPDGGAAADAAPALECGALAACGVDCVDTTSDPLNCGACGRTCVVPGAEAACAAGACTVGRCDVGFYDRDGDPENGCEVEVLCEAGAACATACGTEGAVSCAGDAPVCQPPAEACNLVDDNCDGACDEGAGCRVPVHRGLGNGHLYTTDLGVLQTPPFHVEAANYFHLYAQSVLGMRPVFLCDKGNGKRFLTSENACEIGRAPERTLGFWAPEPLCGAIPLYRLYSETASDHFYTTSAAERDNAIAQYGYRDEGVAGYVWPGP